MTVRIPCLCGVQLTAPDYYAGARAECPSCGRTVVMPKKEAPPVAEPPPVMAEAVEPPPAQRKATEKPSPATSGQDRGFGSSEEFEHLEEAIQFFDPPTAPPPQPTRKKRTPWARQMFESLLDPRSIQWMLTLGGGLMVLGLIIWLASLGIFKSPVMVAVIMGAGSLAILGAGWFVALQTRYKMAGQALTFLGCVVLPLNLWYYHAQGLILLDGGLWQAGLACCLLYAATVYVLRDPLFMYAVEVGISLTMLLLLGSLGHADTAAYVSLVFMGMALISIHVERAFAEDAEVFTRRRFGLPLFWCGHGQLAVSLVVLFFCQGLGWVFEPALKFVDSTWVTNSLASHFLLAGGLWLVGTYAYLYSDIVVRRIGVYMYLAAFCAVMAQVTLVVGYRISPEALITVLAVTALAATFVDRFTTVGKERLGRALPPLAMILGALPIGLGILLHLRATSAIFESINWECETGWPFVGAMLVVAATNRVSAYAYRKTSERMTAAYFFFSAAGLIVAAAGLLRVLNLVEWHQQAPLLMLIPIAYLVASRLWRGHTPERPLGWVAHAAVAVIMLHAVLNVLTSPQDLQSVFRPEARQTVNLLLGITFAQAAVFYVLAAYFRRRSLNVYFAMLALCAALWELMGYAGWFDAPHFTMVYALLGLAFLVVARVLGLEQVPIFRALGRQDIAIRGKGLPAYQGGNAVLLVAFLAAFLQALVRLSSPDQLSVLSIVTLAITTGVSVAAIWLVPSGPWRRLYATSSVALAAATCLNLNLLIDLDPWQKFEIVCVAIGLLLLAGSYVGRFREEDDQAQPQDVVTVGFWLGSLLTALPLLIAVIYHRSTGDGPSLYDELAVLTITVMMLITGLSWRVQSTTLIGGGVLAVYLIILIGRLAYHPQVAVGVYLAVGGAFVFACGIALSVYRERLLSLPERIANREGIFRIIDWR
jgi:hypothetical protein